MNQLIFAIQRHLAHRWGFITQAEHTRLLERGLREYRTQAGHQFDLINQERLNIYRELTEARKRIRDLEGEAEFAREKYEIDMITSISSPTQITSEDF
ncbi:hypothetical protein [Shimia sp.]|uniref:hypothetical protein n=1 Tax=Shimia sp. TaxID=1954381 RepID=UPI003BA99D72